MRMKWPLPLVVIFLILVGGCGESEFNRALRELVEPPEEAIAMSATYQQVIDACKAGDLERAAELETANRPACPEGGTASFEILSTTYRNNMGTLIVERVRADNGNTEVRTLTFKKVEEIWLLDSIK